MMIYDLNEIYALILDPLIWDLDQSNPNIISHFKAYF